MENARAPRVYPVIRVLGAKESRAQADIAFEHPVAGVFLIDHDGDVQRLTRALGAVREHHPDGFVGANLIRTPPARALERLGREFAGPVPIDALWTDDAGVAVGSDELSAETDLTPVRDSLGWRGLHFGGVAFKYQEAVPDSDLPALGEHARRHVDVPTTSGPGTGQAIAVERLRLLRRGLGDHPLALASGVTAENVGDVASLVDHILVSTGISGGRGLDHRRLEHLLEVLVSGPRR